MKKTVLENNGLVHQMAQAIFFEVCSHELRGVFGEAWFTSLQVPRGRL